MRTFSRRMPKFVEQPSPWTNRQLAAVAIVGASVVVGLLWSTPFRFAVATLVAVGVAADLHKRRQLRRISEQRPGEDIGTFAKGFDRRSPEFDPWVVRAVWDALQQYRVYRGGVAPLRPSDSLNASFLDLDDLYEETAPEIAQRTGRSLDNPQRIRSTGRSRPSVTSFSSSATSRRCKFRDARVASAKAPESSHRRCVVQKPVACCGPNLPQRVRRLHARRSRERAA